MNKPDILDYEDYLEYFVHFFEYSKVQNKHFSLNSFATQLGWPSSFPHDILAGRKKLTINRALEFASKHQLNELETEYLVLLTLKTSKEEKVREYFFRKQERSYRVEHDINEALSGEASKKFLDIDFHFIFALLQTSQSLAILRNQTFFKDLFPELTEEKTAKILDFLKEQGMVEVKEDGSLICNNKSAFITEDIIKDPLSFFSQFNKVFHLFLNNLKSDFAIDYAFSQIKKEDYDEVIKDITRLRNKVDFLAKEAIESKVENKETKLILFQLGFQLFPIAEDL